MGADCYVATGSGVGMGKRRCREVMPLKPGRSKQYLRISLWIRYHGSRDFRLSIMWRNSRVVLVTRHGPFPEPQILWQPPFTWAVISCPDNPLVLPNGLPPMTY